MSYVVPSRQVVMSEELSQSILNVKAGSYLQSDIYPAQDQHQGA